MKRALDLSLRLIVAATLTGFILWKSSPREVLAAAAGADWRPMAVAALLVIVDRTLMAYRWVVLLCTVDPAVRPPLAAVMRIFFVSTFIGTFMPANIGGDAVRAYSLAKLNVRGGDAVASVFMDRMLGLASILLMALVGLALARDLAGNVVVISSLVVASMACAATLSLVFSERAADLIGHLLVRMPVSSLQRSGRHLLESIRAYSRHRWQLGNVLGCSVGVQILRVVQAYCLGRGLHIEAGLDAYFACVPLILLVMLLPVTFNGIGTSQAAFVWFFGRAAVPPALSFALSVLFVALGIVGNLPGGLLYVVGRSKREATEVGDGDTSPPAP